MESIPDPTLPLRTCYKSNVRRSGAFFIRALGLRAIFLFYFLFYFSIHFLSRRGARSRPTCRESTASRTSPSKDGGIARAGAVSGEPWQNRRTESLWGMKAPNRREKIRLPARTPVPTPNSFSAQNE